MHEEPLRLIPVEARERFIAELTDGYNGDYAIRIEGDLCPACRFNFRDLMLRYQGDWSKVIPPRSGAAPGVQRAGPHRDRHLPAQG
jgi:serine protein kinase